jgi:putative flippase GtrA
MLSNAAGYGVGITVSFLLNKFGNFRSKGNVRTELPLFIAAFGVAYTVNLFVLWFSGEVLHADAFLAQLAAGAVYTVVFYLFMKSVVFTEVQCKN